LRWQLGTNGWAQLSLSSGLRVSLRR
jgi:hypothetical protein